MFLFVKQKAKRVRLKAEKSRELHVPDLMLWTFGFPLLLSGFPSNQNYHYHDKTPARFSKFVIEL
jgi:hypothetical protein